jgi:hypothetical protein
MALNGNKTIMVNPPLAGAVAECHCENNWTDYHSGGCQTTTITTYAAFEHAELYEPTCPSGPRGPGGYRSYQTTVPGDARVSFSVHTAKSVALLAPPLISVATAKTTPAPDTHHCAPGGAPGCPIDLYTALGGLPDAQRPVLELVMLLEPTSDGTQGPTVEHYTITYSCLETE